MSKIYKNFGVETNITEQNGKFLDISTSGEKINIRDTDIDIINRSIKQKSDLIFGSKNIEDREKIYLDFKGCGFSNKLSNFYADTFVSLGTTEDKSPRSYYKIEKMPINEIVYKINYSGNYEEVTKEVYYADSGDEFNAGDSYRKIKENNITEKKSIIFNEDTLSKISSTIPKSVEFKKNQIINRSTNSLIGN
jgi:hypothetical protein